MPMWETEEKDNKHTVVKVSPLPSTKKKFLAKKILDFEFSHGYHYSHTLEDTWEKTLGSFQPKLMTKIEVISQKPSKTGFLAKMAIFWPKKSPILNFPTGTTTHTR